MSSRNRGNNNNNNSAASSARGGGGGNANNNNEEDEDTPPELSRLLDRLQREHTRNNKAALTSINKTRAKYLLEASGGNVAFASALYWEDYFQQQMGLGGEDPSDYSNANNNDNNEEMETAAAPVAAAAKPEAVKKSASSSGVAAAAAMKLAEAGSDNSSGGIRARKKKNSSAGRQPGVGMMMPAGAMARKIARAAERHGGAKKKEPPSQSSSSAAAMRLANAGSSDSSSGIRARSAAAAAAMARKSARAGAKKDPPYNSKKRKSGSLDNNNSSFDDDDDDADGRKAPRRKRIKREGGGGKLKSDDPFPMDKSLKEWDDDSSPEEEDERKPSAARALGKQKKTSARGVKKEPRGGRGSTGSSSRAFAANRGTSLDEKISSLQERLSNYRSQVQGANAAIAAAGGGGSRSSSSNAASAAARRNNDNNPDEASSFLSSILGESFSPEVLRQLGRQSRGQGPGNPEMNRLFLEQLAAHMRLEGLGGGANNNNNRGARSAAAGAGGGDDSSDDDDDDNHSNSSDNGRQGDDSNSSDNNNNRNNARDDDADNDNEAPLRRSMRLRSQRNVPPRRPNLRAERLAAQRRLDDDTSDSEEVDLGAPDNPPRERNPAERLRARLAAVAVNNNNVNEVDDISDDENNAFVPGPEPVLLRIESGNEVRKFLTRTTGKRKEPSGRQSKKEHYGLGSDSDDCSLGLYEDEPIEVDLWLHKSTEFAEPSRELWGTYPRHSEDSDDSDDDSVSNDEVHFPISFLRSGFKLSKCGNGLAVSAPSDEEWDRTRRTNNSSVLRDGRLKGIRGLFPYNCKGVSALLSLVTGLLYSGASVQGGISVTCDAAQEPFDSLSLEQRKRQFDPRLTDALTALIFVAAQAGSRRCGETLQKYDKHWACRRKRGNVTLEDEDTYTNKRLELQRRAHLAQLCWWETDADNVTILPQGKNPKNVKFKTSFTTIHNIKSYVKTHLKSFKEPGGLALLLETILRCHGPTMTCPQKMLNCQCSAALKQLEKNVKNKNSDVAAKFEEHDCMSVQLLSLLLTGEIHNNYENWSADMLGLGIMRKNKDNSPPLGGRLLRPIKPVWMCIGELGYSTLFLDTKNFIGSTNSLENPGKSFILSHWNVWSGERAGFRVITSMHDGGLNQNKQLSLGVIPDDIDSDDDEGRTVKDSISTHLFLEHKRDAVLPQVDPDLKPITDEELASVSFHPEDKKYYPKQYRRWRFHFGDGSSTAMTSSLSVTLAANEDGWVPFFRLQGRQRLIVEMKLAPRICGIIRSRWPLATVRDMAKVPLV